MDRAHSRFGNEDMTWQKGWPGNGRRKLKRHPRSSFSASKLHESFNFVVEVTFYSFMTPDFHFGQMFFLKDLHQIKLQSDSKVAKVAMVAAVKDCEQCLACVSHLCIEVAGGKVARWPS